MITRRVVLKSLGSCAFSFVAMDPLATPLPSALYPTDLKDTVKTAMSIAKVAKTASEAAVNFTKVAEFLFGAGLSDSDFKDIMAKLSNIEQSIKALQSKLDSLEVLIKGIPAATVSAMNEQELIQLMNQLATKRAAFTNEYGGKQKNFLLDHELELKALIARANALQNSYLSPSDPMSYLMMTPFMSTLLSTQIGFYELADEGKKKINSDLAPYRSYFISGIKEMQKVLTSYRDERKAIVQKWAKPKMFYRVQPSASILYNLQVGPGESFNQNFAEFVDVSFVEPRLEVWERYVNCAVVDRTAGKLTDGEQNTLRRAKTQFDEELDLNLGKIATNLQCIHTATNSLSLVEKLLPAKT